MPGFNIVSVTQPHTNSSHEHITAIAYYDSFSRKIIITIKEAVKRIDENPLEFYVRTGRGKAYLTVVRTADLEPFVKTIPDDTGKDNLLSLPPCYN